MQNGNQSSLDAASNQISCTFCQQNTISDVLKETPNFLVAADHAPLVEGHLLVIPRQHYACYGDVPARLDEELFAIKNELRQFYSQFYASVVFWEHGVFRQTVFHAHLHCFPWGNLEYDLANNVHSSIVTTQEDIRSWYQTHGHYFYLEDEQAALLFAPEADRYMHVIQQVFQKSLIKQGGGRLQMRSSQQRQSAGRPLIESTIARWQTFQQESVR